MDLYTFVVFVHIAAAVALLSGSVVASPAVRAAVQRARTTQDIRAYLAIGRPLLVFEPVSALFVLASGIYLTSIADFWNQGWIQVAIGFWVANAAVAGAVVKPAIGRVAAHAAAAPDGPVGQDLDAVRASRAWFFGGDVLMANDAAMLLVMVIKPALIGSLIVVAGAFLMIAVLRAIRHVLRAADVPPGVHQYP